MKEEGDLDHLLMIVRAQRRKGRNPEKEEKVGAVPGKDEEGVEIEMVIMIILVLIVTMGKADMIVNRSEGDVLGAMSGDGTEEKMNNDHPEEMTARIMDSK